MAASPLTTANDAVSPLEFDAENATSPGWTVMWSGEHPEAASVTSTCWAPEGTSAADDADGRDPEHPATAKATTTATTLQRTCIGPSVVTTCR